MKASCTKKSSRLRERAADGGGEIDPGCADPHKCEQNAPDNGKDDGGRRERRLHDGLPVVLCAVSGQPAGECSHCLRKKDPEYIGFPREFFHRASPESSVCSPGAFYSHVKVGSSLPSAHHAFSEQTPEQPPPLSRARHTSWVMVPMGQYTHQVRGRKNTMVTRPSTVEVSITL